MSWHGRSRSVGERILFRIVIMAMPKLPERKKNAKWEQEAILSKAIVQRSTNCDGTDNEHNQRV